MSKKYELFDSKTLRILYFEFPPSPYNIPRNAQKLFAVSTALRKNTKHSPTIYFIAA